MVREIENFLFHTITSRTNEPCSEILGLLRGYLVLVVGQVFCPAVGLNRHGASQD